MSGAGMRAGCEPRIEMNSPQPRDMKKEIEWFVVLHFIIKNNKRIKKYCHNGLE